MLTTSQSESINFNIMLHVHKLVYNVLIEWEVFL